MHVLRLDLFASKVLPMEAAFPAPTAIFLPYFVIFSTEVFFFFLVKINLTKDAVLS